MNKLIVEGKSDQAFVKALVNHLNLPNIEFENPPLCKIDKYDCLEGEGALGTQLKRLMWLHYYIRYDTCEKDEKRKLEEYCNIRQLDCIFEKQKQKQKKIFNFDDDCLNDLKTFLRMFE